MRNGFSNTRQAVDLDGPLPVSAPFVEANGRVGTISKAGVLRRTGMCRCKRSVEYAKPLPEGGVDPPKGRRTNGSPLVQYRQNLGVDEPGR